MDALLIAVLNAVWQGAAVIALVTIAMRAGLRRNATTACVVWSIAFAIVAALPFVDLASARASQAAPSQPVLATVAATMLVDGPVVTETESTLPAAPVHATVAAPSAFDAFASRIATLATRAGSIATGLARTWGTVVACAWALTAGVLLLRLAVAYRAVARVKRLAVPIDDPVIGARLRAAGHRRRAVVAQSDDVGVPCAIGFGRPMIIIPAALVASLEREDLARVVLHESAHLQRYDDWTNALEQIVCALQFFQPALYLARRSIDFEREIACDDRVLADAGEPLRYAECLARIVQRQRHGARLAVVPGFAMRRAHVLVRVRRIVDRSRDASPQLRAGAAVAVALVVAGTLGIARLQVPLVAPASATTAAGTENVAPPAPLRQRGVSSDETTLSRHVAPAPHADRERATARVSPLHLARVAPIAPADAAHLPRVAPLAPSRALPASAKVRVAPIRLQRIAPAAPVAPHAPSAPNASVSVGDGRRVIAFVDRGGFAYETETVAPAATASAPPSPPAPAPVAPTPAVFRFVMPPMPPMPSMAPMDAETSKRLHDLSERVRVEIEHARNGMPDAETMRRINAEIAAATSAYRFEFRTARGGDLLDAIDAAKYPHPSVDDLIALHDHGIGGSYVRAMGALGPNRPSLHDMIALADQGIGATYVRGLIDAGMRNLTPAQLIALHSQGVDGAFVRRLATHGYRNLSVDELVRLHASGI